VHLLGALRVVVLQALGRLRVKALAVIPSIGRSPLLPDLVALLVDEYIDVLLIDNLPGAEPSELVTAQAGPGVRVMHRPAWRGIYRQWNVGLRLGWQKNVPVLVLNDDIVLPPWAPTTMVNVLADSNEWSLLGFDYRAPEGHQNMVSPLATPTPTKGTWRHGGLGGFAFGAHPRRCTRVDERFKWWGGDDDLVFSTAARGGKVGVLVGCPVLHPQPSLTANSSGDLLPDGWDVDDNALLHSKWGAGWY
jgi:hypothetical protein